MSALTETWKSNNPDYEYNFCDEKKRLELIEEHFDKDWLKIYTNCKSAIFRANIWEILVMYEYGGIFADIDTICLRSIDLFINRNNDFVCEAGFEKTYGWINNSIWGSTRRGEFITLWKDYALERLLNMYPEQPTIAEAGPLGLSNCMDILIKKNNASSVQFCEFNYPILDRHNLEAKPPLITEDSVIQINASTIWNDANPGFDFSYLNDIYADILSENNFQIKISTKQGHGGYPMEINNGF